ncbi:MAG TPA: TonB-dependent receptor [Panacibacter sp.]|nr:TonB-dependent receptor [Panacibacter sp.]
MINKRLKRLCALLLALCFFTVGYAQNKVITGIISDENGVPLSGATIQVKNEKKKIVSDANGSFRIDVSANAKALIISYVGMKDVEVSILDKTNILITLKTGDSKLSDVVVIGYGTAKKANLTGAQTSVSAKEIDKTVNTTIEQALQGRAAGVYVTQNSGQPGGGMSVNIRGVNSINGTNEPLYVIDGVQIAGQTVSYGTQSSSNPLAGLNPSDIEDIQILQGPSATAIYGSRATNGVVLITTKRGKAGDAKLNYGAQYDIQTPPKHFDVMDLRQYAQLVKEYHAIAGGTTPDEFLDPSLLGKGTDWQDELFNNAPLMKHQLSMSGGNEKTTYYMSGEYLDQKGIAVGSGFKRYGFRTNLETKPREWITFGANLAFNQTDEKLTTSQESIISNALRLTPQIPVKNLDGSWAGGDVNNGANQFAPVNPVAIGTLTTNNNVRRQFLGSANLALKLTKNLSFRTSFNTDMGFGNSAYYVPVYHIGWAINATASLNNRNSTSYYWNWNQLLEYTKQFGKHNVDIMASHEAQASSWKNVSAGRTGFLTNDILDLEAGDPLTATNNGGSGKWAMESYLSRASYNYDNRYILVGTVRTDGSVNFGPGNKWGIFPSVSAAWRISQESFFNAPAISELKLRVETGLTGNQGGGGIYSPLNTGATQWGTGFLPGKYSNPNLQWEETKTDNIGINIGLLKNRFNIEFDYYVKNTNNLLMDNPLPWYMGTTGQGSVGSPTVNIGALQNKGWSLTFNTTNINNKNFTWSSNLNLSGFKTKIKKFYSDAATVDRVLTYVGGENTAWTQRSAVNQAPWLFYGYVYDGLFQSIDDINNSAVPVDNTGTRYATNEATGLWVGDVKYKDLSGPNGIPDGIIDTYDQTFIGNPWPKLFGGFTNTFTYKGFELSVLITGTYGNDVYNYIAKVNSNPNNVYLSRNFLVDVLNYAKPIADNSGKVTLENAGTDVPRITNSNIANDNNNQRHSTKWVEDGSFIRLKNVSLSYNVPTSVLSRIKAVKGIRATVGAQNLATLTHYSGFDPEVGAYVGQSTSASTQAIGLDYGRYPLTPIYTFSLNINF